MASSASEIGHRFHDEQEYIERYVRLLRAKSTLHDRQVYDLNRILKRVRIKPLPRRSYDRVGEPYSPKEMLELLEAIRRIEPEVYQTILGHEQRLDDIPSILMNGPAADHMDRLHEWVDYLMDRLSDDPEDDEVKNVIRNAMEEAETIDQDLDEEDRISPEALRALLTVAVDHALHVKVNQRVDAMVYAREQFEEIEVLARMATPHAEINILRQGFVLLMTAFDAAVFDLTRVAFRRRFFELIGVFGKQDKVSLEALGEAGTFGAFRDHMIEEQLKKRYLKDLLGLLQGLGVELADEKDGDRPVQLVELVLRRNLHVHNRGVVDDRYLEADPKTGKPKYNLFNLSLGQPASIDDDYYQTAVRLCGNCVERLVRWASE
jgi:hypothetical protein